jgi:hypothetical protein
MLFTSWFTGPELLGDSAMNVKDRQPRRQPIQARPSLECLEERALLDASSGLIGGASGNLNLNSNFNLASNGAILPTAQNFPNTTAVTANVFPNAGAGTALAVSSSFIAQDQISSQFRDFAINSQGASVRLDLNTQVGMMTGAFGFGSGTQPNAPWKPNAYNLGLANRQPDYSTQTDNGFASASPWSRQWSSPVAQLQRSQSNNPDSPLDEDQLHYLNKDELGKETPEQFVAQRSIREPDQPQQDRLDKDVDDNGDDLQDLIEQQLSEKKPPIETIEKADGTLPDSLWLSALAPAPMAALIAGLPGMPAAAEGADAGGESCNVAAPE